MVLKKRLIFFLLLLALPLVSASVYIQKDGTLGPVMYETGAVNFNGTHETLAMILTVGPSQGYWIIPIPSSEASVASLNNFPAFEGEELKTASQSTLISVYEWLWALQGYPLPYLSLVSSTFSVDRNEPEYTHLISDKFDSSGISAELVAPDKLFSYFRGKANISILEPKLQDYVAKNYSFAVANFKGSNSTVARSLLLVFKTENPMYPSGFYSFYPEKHRRIVFVLGNYDFGNSSEHLYNSKISFFPKEFFGKEGSGKIDYKRIELDGTSEETLFDQVPEKDFALVLSVKKHPFLWGFFIYLFLSMISSLIAGAIVFRFDRPNLLNFFVFGAYNLLSLVGFWIMSYLFRVDERYTEHETSIDQVLELTTGKRVALLIPILLLGLIIVLIPVSLLLELGSIFGPLFMSDIFIFLFIPLLVFTILVLWGKFKQERVLYYNLVFTLSMFVLLVFSFFFLLFFL